MNIFYLDNDPILAARAHCDQHINKMIIESCQMLSTAARVLYSPEPTRVYNPTKKKFINLHIHPTDEIVRSNGRLTLIENNIMLNTHINHPCNKWVRESIGNYYWLYDLVQELNDTWHAWRGKQHNSTGKIIHPLNVTGMANPDSIDMTPPAKAMPIMYWKPDPVESYRAYYQAKLREWKATPGKENYANYSVYPQPKWLDI